MSAIQEGQQVEVTVKAKVVQSKGLRLVFVGPIFDEWDIEAEPGLANPTQSGE